MRALAAAIIIFSVIGISLFGALTIKSLTFFGYWNISGSKALSPSGINAINIDDPGGLVYIKAYNGSQIIIRYTSTSDLLTPLTPKINTNNGTLLITIGQVYLNMGYSVDLNLSVPEALSPDVTVKLGAGNVIVQLPSSEILTVEDGAGNVQLNITRSVQIKVEDAAGNVELWTSNVKYIYTAVITGDITALINGRLSGDYQFYSTTGNINVMIPADSSVSFTVSSTAGSTVIEGIPYNSISNSLSGRISGTAGNGTATLIESVTTGSAYLKGI